MISSPAVTGLPPTSATTVSGVNGAGPWAHMAEVRHSTEITIDFMGSPSRGFNNYSISWRDAGRRGAGQAFLFRLPGPRRGRLFTAADVAALHLSPAAARIEVGCRFFLGSLAHLDLVYYFGRTAALRQPRGD